MNTLAFTIHKLIAVSAAVVAVMAVVALLRQASIGAPAAGLMIITGLLLLSLFVSGACLSFEKPVNVVLSAIHKAVPILTAASAVLLAYLLRTRM